MNAKNTSKNLRRKFAGTFTLALAGGFSSLSIQSFAEEATAARLDAIQAQMAIQEVRLAEQETEIRHLREAADEAAENREAIPERALFTSGWDRGFVLQSEDGDYRMNIGGWIQPRYEYQRNSGDDEDTSSFFLRRVRLDVRGHVFQEDLTYRVMPEFAGGSTVLRDAWINYAFDPSLEVRMGQFTVPFQWHRSVGPRRQHFAERGVPSEAFGFRTGRDSGIMLHGRNDANTLAYGTGIFDGAGRNVGVSNSNGHMVSGRLTWAALGTVPREESDFAFSEDPQVSFGGGVQAANKNEARPWDLGRSVVVPTANRRADWVAGTADAVFRWRGFSAAIDGQLRRVDPDDNAVDSYTGWGYMATTGYFIVPKRYEIVGRFSQLRLDRDDGDTEETEWGVGLNVYHRGHGWKTRFNVLTHDTDDLRTNRFIVEHHLQF